MDKTYIFDLDQTLYPYHSDIIVQIDEKIALYCQKIFSCSYDEAHAIRQKYYLKYGATLTGLMVEHQVDIHGFLDDVHNINYDSLVFCDELYNALSTLVGRKIIYTNGTYEHAVRVLEKRGLSDLFLSENIYDIRRADLSPKPCPKAFELFLKTYNISPQNAVFFDDNVHNVQTAQTFGITSWIIREQADISSSNDNHHQTIYNLAGFLKDC